MPVSATYHPSQRHAELGDGFFDAVAAADFPSLTLRFRNQRWAGRVGLASLDEAEWLAHFGGFEPLPGNLPQPLALRYHGHQFRSYNPDLGDGRGFLFAQLHDDRDRLLDLATKGSGRTPWSRGADGRLTLKGGVREVLATEMLEALGVDTSRSFSLIETGESLDRGDEPSPTRSAVLTRLSHSHIRIGSFQRFAYHQDQERLVRLLDYTIRTYMPALWTDDPGQRAAAFLREVTARVAVLGASWMAAGFVHGVLNTDNINVTGESFDYGPWRFLPVYDLEFTAAYFDSSGLYAYGRQPGALLWNLSRLAECLLGLADQPALEAVLETFPPAYYAALTSATLRRLGLAETGQPQDEQLTAAWWNFLHASQVGFEQALFDWHGGLASLPRARRSPAAQAYAAESFAPVRLLLEQVPPAAGLRLDHPYFSRSTPRTMLIDEVEALWAPIAAADDWSLFHATLAEIGQMREAYSTS